MRIVDGATNPTYWLLNDHLGSTAITADANGTKTAELRFKAWGESRFTYGSTPTTYRYTGQREQSQLSIYFYGARWYDPALSRFLSPDSIIPGAGNSQAWDKFAYALNSPVNFIDPTGHAVQRDRVSEPGYAISFNKMIEKYRVNFKGTWSTIQKAWVMLGIDAVGRAHARNMKGTSASEAFKAVYGIKDGRTMDMEMGDCGPRNGKGGCGSPAAGSFTWGSREIEFADGAPFSGPGPNRSARLASEMNIHQVVHELGHAFAARFTNDNPSNPYHLLEKRDDLLNPLGYASPDESWRPNKETSPHETWANMYLGWTYGQWGSGDYADNRIEFMGNMAELATIAAGR